MLGKVRINYVLRFAHRVSYEALVGPIPNGLQIDHLCNQPACVNPSHLLPVTGKQNVLRSRTAPTAINSRKTHCPAGHPYTPENTLVYRGQRICATCHRAKNAADYAAQHPEQLGSGYWQRSRTHCRKGHPYDEENTRWVRSRKRGTWTRECITCVRERKRDSEQRRRMGGKDMNSRTGQHRFDTPGPGSLVGKTRRQRERGQR